MLQGFVRVAFVGFLVFAISTSARAATYSSCPGKISYYTFYDQTPSIQVVQEYFQGIVAPLFGGPLELRVARELAREPGSPAKSAIIYPVCSAQIAMFEASVPVVSKTQLSYELYALRNAAGAVIGTQFLDRDVNAVGGSVGIQDFYQCSTITVDGIAYFNVPMILNVAMFHTGADTTAINATAAQIETNWLAPLRDRLTSASEDWMVAHTACSPITKAEFGQMVDAGATPLVQYQMFDPADGVNAATP